MYIYVKKYEPTYVRTYMNTQECTLRLVSFGSFGTRCRSAGRAVAFGLIHQSIPAATEPQVCTDP